MTKTSISSLYFFKLMFRRAADEMQDAPTSIMLKYLQVFLHIILTLKFSLRCSTTSPPKTTSQWLCLCRRLFYNHMYGRGRTAVLCFRLQSTLQFQSLKRWLYKRQDIAVLLFVASDCTMQEKHLVSKIF